MMLLQTVGAFVVALGILIVVHEYGHYIVARACGVKVLRFSVGFGKPLLLVRRGADRTEWVLSAIPFGGYVKMLDEREGPVDAAEAGRAFNRQTVWKRIAIVVAGPLFNFLFAIAVYSGLFMYGLPEARPVIAEPGAGVSRKRRDSMPVIPCAALTVMQSPLGRSSAGECSRGHCRSRPLQSKCSTPGSRS